MEISVELSPNCNYHCKNCIVHKRLHSNYKKIDEELVDKIIKYVPKNSKLYIVGLGEPTLKKTQEEIYKILNKRKDIDIFVQTNGSQKIINKLIPYWFSNRLEFGLSYDLHHLKNNNAFIKIQKELVSGIATSKSKNSQVIKQLELQFPNISRIHIGSLVDNHKKYKLTFQELLEIVDKYVNEYKDKNIIITLESIWELNNGLNNKYYEELNKELQKAKPLTNNWFKLKNGSYIDNTHIQDPRILIDGKITTDTYIAIMSQEELDKLKLPSIEKYFR